MIFLKSRHYLFKLQVCKNPNAISRRFWLQCAGELENQTTKEDGPAAVKLLMICHLKINHCLEKKKKYIF